MKKFEKILIFFIFGIFIFSFAWFNFSFTPENISNFEERLFETGKENEVIIIFNSGGWGTKSLNSNSQLNSIVSEIKKILEEENYRIEVVEYNRTKESFLGKVGSIKEILSNFSKTSRIFATKIEEFLIINPERKIIMAGLSNGASFIDSAMEELEQKMENVISIELGAPFWGKNIQGENILKLKNEEDILAKGDIKKLLVSLSMAPFVWTYKNLKGEKTSFSEAIVITGHRYYWPEIEQEVKSFVYERF
jgi:hypothetical protein